jgi:hypothetical protein
MKIGDTFVIGEGGHLWIVISDPAKHSSRFVIANLTTDANRAGTDCELNRGDHQWIREVCYINFGDAREVTPIEEARISECIEDGRICKHFPMKSAVLQRIICAAKKSKALPTGLRKYF